MPVTAFDPFASAAVITMARQGRMPRPLDLPVALRPCDADQAYAVQDAVVRERGEIAGWKVGAASPQALPARAALTRDSVCVAPAGQALHLPAAGFAVMGVEAELVYELGIDLPDRPTPYSAAEVLAKGSKAVTGMACILGVKLGGLWRGAGPSCPASISNDCCPLASKTTPPPPARS